MTVLLLDGRAIDAIIALVAIEGFVLVAWRARTGRGLPVSAFLANLLAGAGLLLALRGAMVGASSEVISACLGVAFAAHVADMAGRWRSASGSSSPRRQTIDGSRNALNPKSSHA
jgi:hypothetical protein